MKKIRMNMIVGKKQIILAALVLCLSLAVYLNWVYAGGDGFELPTTSTLDTDKSYGDSQYVNIGDDAEAFFAEAKISRQKTRDEAVQTLKNLIESDAITPEQRTELALQTTSMAQAVETEGKIENLIKAKGFTECMVYYDTERVDVIVKTNGLLTNEVAQMKDIIVKEVTVPDENIAIIEVN
ncbi:MAG: SpoIIIAH-like family protein [Candidatus Fimivivens sp.]